MKICITAELLRHTPFTGVENYAYQLIQSLSHASNIPLSVIVGPDIGGLQLPDSIRKIIHRPLKFPGRYSLSAFLAPPKCINSFDIIHCPTVAAPFFFKPRAKVIMTVHDLIPVLYPQWHIQRRKIYFKHFLKYRFRFVDHFIAVSANTKRDLIGCFGIDPQKVSIVHEGIGKQFSHGTGDRDNFILAVGTIEPRKNLKRVIKAFLRAREKYGIANKLLIAGTMGWNCREEMALMRTHRASVKALGYVSDQDLVDLYRKAACLVYPSLYEGFGLPVIEAMACGCPVITSNVSSLPEVAGEAALTVNPYCTDEIAEAIFRVISDRDLHRRLSNAGRRRAGGFTWDRCAGETLNVYKKVMQN